MNEGTPNPNSDAITSQTHRKVHMTLYKMLKTENITKQKQGFLVMDTQVLSMCVCECVCVCVCGLVGVIQCTSINGDSCTRAVSQSTASPSSSHKSVMTEQAVLVHTRRLSLFDLDRGGQSPCAMSRGVRVTVMDVNTDSLLERVGPS